MASRSLGETVASSKGANFVLFHQRINGMRIGTDPNQLNRKNNAKMFKKKKSFSLFKM